MDDGSGGYEETKQQERGERGGGAMAAAAEDALEEALSETLAMDEEHLELVFAADELADFTHEQLECGK